MLESGRELLVADESIMKGLAQASRRARENEELQNACKQLHGVAG